jgi:DNA-directed RNA polymerase II subunit RPB9
MLYGQENPHPDDHSRKILAFVCLNEKCGMYRESVVAEDSCVFKRTYKKQFVDVTDNEATKRLIMKTYGAADDIISDPTLPRSRDEIECSECMHTEAVFFQGQGLSADEAMRLFFVCTNCKHQWT